MSDGQSNILPIRAPRPCPECKRVSSREYYPFCSRRCKEIDLNRWLSGSYSIAGKPAEDDQEAPGEE
jgi:endogenous inhibitor of DNA gyrase (YacG/DUF329 family)